MTAVRSPDADRGGGDGGRTVGHCFFTAGFDITAAMNGEQTVRLVVSKGDGEFASDAIMLTFAVP